MTPIEPCAAERMGKHEEKLENLEKNLQATREENQANCEEIKSDIKSLISTLEKYMEKGQKHNEERIKFLEKKVENTEILLDKVTESTALIDYRLSRIEDVFWKGLKGLGWTTLIAFLALVAKHIFFLAL